MVNRRELLIGGGAALISFAAVPAARSADLAFVVRRLERDIRKKRDASQPISVEWVIQSLKDLEPQDKRIAVFELVRRVPYKLTSWKGDPMSLFSLGRGDCRHKEAATTRLFKAMDYRAQHVQVLFNWADLPIPQTILGNLVDTRGFHDTTEVVIEGNNVLVDPTWDPLLAKGGFPILANWDGVTPTTPVTRGKLTSIRPGDVSPGVNLYEKYGIPWPVRKQTLAFNREFNAWTDGVRVE
ncbi:MAG: hypothetical protein ACYC10_18790 [Allorhizobium sp.]